MIKASSAYRSLDANYTPKTCALCARCVDHAESAHAAELAAHARFVRDWTIETLTDAGATNAEIEERVARL